MKILLFLCIIALVSADTKSWTRDLNFESTDNWDIQRTPCPSDTILIPEQASSVFLQINGTLKEIVLPMTGEVVLGSNQQLYFSDDAAVDPSCNGEDVTFTRNGPADWFNPSNWKTSNGPILVESEQIPCQYEDVVFPEEKQFDVTLDQPEYMSRITFDGRMYTSTNAFSAFLRSPIGQQQFSMSRNGQILLQGVRCADTTGCTCRNNGENTLGKICSYVSCPSLACSDAPMPYGGCCGICGAILHLKYTSEFDFEGIRTKLMHDYIEPTTTRVRRQSDATVLMYMSKTDSEFIQIVLMDTGTGSGQDAAALASQIEADINNDPAAFGVSEVTMESSQTSTDKRTGGMSGGATVGIILVVILAIIISVSIVFVMFKRSTSLNIRFKKDEPLNSMDIELSSSNAIQDVEPHMNGDMVMGFDNPMYITPNKDNLYGDPSSVAKLPPDMPDIEDRGVIPEGNEYIEGFSNPLSGTFESVA